MKGYLFLNCFNLICFERSNEVSLFFRTNKVVNSKLLEILMKLNHYQTIINLLRVYNLYL